MLLFMIKGATQAMCCVFWHFNKNGDHGSSLEDKDPIFSVNGYLLQLTHLEVIV